MRQLTNAEKTLGGALGLAVFVGANLIGLTFYQRGREAALKSIEKSKIDVDSAQILLNQKPMWDERRAWIAAKQPVMESPGSAISQFLSELQDGAQAAGLTLASPAPDAQPVDTEFYRSVGISFKVSGDLQNLVQWMASLQQPEGFTAVTKFTLKNLEEPPKVEAELQVTRWYAPKPPEA